MICLARVVVGEGGSEKVAEHANDIGKLENCFLPRAVCAMQQL